MFSQKSEGWVGGGGGAQIFPTPPHKKGGVGKIVGLF